MVKDGNGKEKVVVFIDQGLSKANPSLIENILSWFEHHKKQFLLAGRPVIMPGGETVKNGWEYVLKATGLMNDLELDRHSYVIAIGGGAFLDMTGFAVSIFHRGLKLIRIPTTTLAQNDAGIGVKNGINQYGQKNCIGTFSPPFSVVNDFEFLTTLPFDHFIGGVAEAFKIALIKDASLFVFLEKNCTALKQRNSNVIQEVIRRCAVLHMDHISNNGDPFETGSSRPLDYGHWTAHKMEILSGSTLSHGQAVSIGIALDSFYAWKKSLISKKDFSRLLTALVISGLPIWSKYLEIRDPHGTLEIKNGLEEFRQHLGGMITLTMPDGIGTACEINEMDFDIIEKGITFLKKISNEN